MDMRQTFEGLLDYWGGKTPDKEAVYDGLRRMSYGELKREAGQLAKALACLNIQAGDKVLAILPNWHEFIVLFFALAKMEAVLVPCGVSLTAKEISQRCQMIQPKLAFVSGHDQLRWLEAEAGCCKIIAVRFEDKKAMGYSELLALGEKNREQKLPGKRQDEVMCTIIFTSGTTGAPKGVELTDRSIMQTAISIGIRLESSHRDVFLVPLPCTHLFGIVTGMVVPLYVGAKIVIMERFRAKEALKLIEQEQITVHHGVPTMFIRELEDYKGHEVNLQSLRTGVAAGAICSEEVLKKITDIFKFNLMVAYGLTEFVGVSMTTLSDTIEDRLKTVGKPYEGIQVRAVHESGRTAEPGEVGELCCKGYGAMKGYYQLPAQTRKVLDAEGWLHTGDLARIDERGYITIVGRKKEVIIRGGYNIYPREIEEVYYNHPEVMEACVIGLPHQDLGEQTVAFIQLKSHSQQTAALLREYAKGKIAKYKVPDRVLLVEQLPKLSNGKIDKRELGKMAVSL
ncbi:fatty-acyl-CoA synthase/long-chain acyl-CoA synthetase [Desulfitobacterium sp. LBE]|uniref:AMP-dependent synthetase and ligase n=1 Tax=Desulfitobacterium hafniense (strain DSM 10664 / DCB-2) TaxID=272564 RepID=B8G0W3_DESHD|nr:MULTISPECIES: class I adenylate-forming enzyme family protein [Desulfitobacterium]ACL18382.1 AMP-dependent synthetase and ligase [Desulfitobacterium hafniense DCB-2]TWH58690.1 fatty-acyl-CoA synthase/long-chain acyl-CoA synthetase [Desulfitobacterium sp. LBE]